MKQGLVSVIMPVYDGAFFLAEAIESVVNQTYSSWELLISDDGSTDESVRIAQDYAEADARIIVISSGDRGGSGVARNRALHIAKGRWIAFLDSDDTWHPEKLTRTLDFALSRQLALTCTDYIRLSSNRSVLIRTPRILTYRELLRGNQIGTSTVLIDRTLVTNLHFGRDFKPDDFVTWLELTKQGHTAGGLQMPLSIYRKVGRSQSANKAVMAIRVFRILKFQQALSWPAAVWYFLNYAVRGAIKHSPLTGLTFRRRATY